jgi:hypothetical protein
MMIQSNKIIVNAQPIHVTSTRAGVESELRLNKKTTALTANEINKR